MKKVGDVTEEEKEEIYDMFEKYNALCNLKNIISSHDEMYSKLVFELEKIEKEQNIWWKKKQKKYNWELQNEREWMIDFSSNEIYLV